MVKPRAIATLMMRHGDRVADIACGTGEEVAAMAVAATSVSAFRHVDRPSPTEPWSSTGASPRPTRS
jgi:ubiquinone/menaquinone biosynthesis C-methylase UbiE